MDDTDITPETIRVQLREPPKEDDEPAPPKRLARMRIALCCLRDVLQLPDGVETIGVAIEGWDSVMGRLTLLLEGPGLPDYCQTSGGTPVPLVDASYASVAVTLVDSDGTDAGPVEVRLPMFLKFIDEPPENPEGLVPSGPEPEAEEDDADEKEGIAMAIFHACPECGDLGPQSGRCRSCGRVREVATPPTTATEAATRGVSKGGQNQRPDGPRPNIPLGQGTV